MDYKKVENFAFWAVMAGMGIVLRRKGLRWRLPHN